MWNHYLNEISRLDADVEADFEDVNHTGVVRIFCTSLLAFKSLPAISILGLAKGNLLQIT